MDWELFKYRVEDIWSRIWWLVLILPLVVPLAMFAMGFDPVSEPVDCVRYSHLATDC